MPLAGEIIDAADVPGDWIAYTPVLAGTTSGGGIGNGTATGRYRRDGDTVTAMIHIVWGSTTSWGVGSGTVTLPVAGRATAPPHCAEGLLIDASAGRTLGVGQFDTVNRVIMVAAINLAAAAVGGVVAPTAPWTWTTSDEVRLTAVYEAA
jgi:hypothetical protein